MSAEFAGFPKQERLESFFTDQGALGTYSRNELVEVSPDPKTGQRRYVTRTTVVECSDGAVACAGQRKLKDLLPGSFTVKTRGVQRDHAETTDDPQMLVPALSRITGSAYTYPDWLYKHSENWRQSPLPALPQRLARYPQ